MIYSPKTSVLSGREHCNHCSPLLSTLACVLLVALTYPAFAGTPVKSPAPRITKGGGAEVVEIVVPNEFNEDLRNLPSITTPSLSNPPVEVNPRQQHGGPTVIHSPPAPQVDPLLLAPNRGNLRSQVMFGAPISFNTPLLNFKGQDYNGVFPPDTVGDVGPNHYIQMINSPSGAAFKIYSKTGVVLVDSKSLEDLATTAACKTGAGGDPIVLYDLLADRWLLSEMTDKSAGNHLCIYISKTGNPVSGGWWVYDFTTPYFPDYPHYAVQPDAYYVATNEDKPAAYALDRKKMLQGLPATYKRFVAPRLPGFGFQAFTPADLDGKTPPPAGAQGYFVRQVDDELHYGAHTPTDYLEIWALHADFVNPANSTFKKLPKVPVADFNSALCETRSDECIPQPGTSRLLDPLREITMWRVQYRNFGGTESLVGNFTVDVNSNNHAGIRWFVLNKTTKSNWLTIQQGTHSPDSANRWMGSIAMDACGNLALGYSVSSGTVFPGIRYAGRLLYDAPGQLPWGENLIVAGLSSQTNKGNGNRWGDYSSMNVDPTDDRTFWYTNEYMSTGGKWTTRIASFRFPYVIKGGAISCNYRQKF
ncbi:MAG: hypothetical protein WCS87_05400 [Methylococcaceae bacterium]